MLYFSLKFPKLGRTHFAVAVDHLAWVWRLHSNSPSQPFLGFLSFFALPNNNNVVDFETEHIAKTICWDVLLQLLIAHPGIVVAETKERQLEI